MRFLQMRSATAVVLATLAGFSTFGTARLTPTARSTCPVRTELVRRNGITVCVPDALLRLFKEADEQTPPPQLAAYRRAVEQKQRMLALQKKIAHADGVWEPYGDGGLVADDPNYGGDNGLGNVSGLVAGLAYDPTHQRMFAAVSAGGVWMSQARNGDIATLGDDWFDIGRSLPTQSTAHVAWTKANGGELVVLTGEHTLDGGSYPSLGVYTTHDLGITWRHASGVPDSSAAFRLAVDPAHPSIVYAATSAGLFRSADGARSFVNATLPTSHRCRGRYGPGRCQFANMVTDVVVRAPGGKTGEVCKKDGCPTLAAVGWPWGRAPYPNGVEQAPGNGLYRSTTGKAGTFVLTGDYAPSSQVPIGFTPRGQIGRIELGAATGDAQDHNVVYAIVNDSVLTNAGFPLIDVHEDKSLDDLKCESYPRGPSDACPFIKTGTMPQTTLNGVYVSRDFGATWIRLADEAEIAFNPTTDSALVPFFALFGYAPGVQSRYNMWIGVDPTQADSSTGAPTRMAFGLEELWTNRAPVPFGATPATENDFKVIGQYYAGRTCAGVFYPTAVCPSSDGLGPHTTTHPDQHDGLFVPDPHGGVWLFTANDGGIYKQYSADPVTDPFNNLKWGRGANRGFNTLIAYGLAVGNDGTVYFGLQDNGTAKTTSDGHTVDVFGGDGVHTEVDPDDPDVAFYQTPQLSLFRTMDGGHGSSDISPPAGHAYFTSPFALDPIYSNHLVAAGSVVAESIGVDGPPGDEWKQVYNLGKDKPSGLPHQARGNALAVRGNDVYVGWCGPCKPLDRRTPRRNIEAFGFHRGIATNVAGTKSALVGTKNGWHEAAARGLPHRVIQDIEIDPASTKHIYVAVGAYNNDSELVPGQYLDTTKDVGSPGVYESTDAGENFRSTTGNLPPLDIKSMLVAGKQLIVGTDIGAFISSDLHGTQWAPMGNLPAITVTQLVRDPKDAKRVFASTHGRGIWTYRLR